MPIMAFFLSHGVKGLALLSFAESSFFPIPPDVLLITLCLAIPEQSFYYALICTIFSVVGGVFGYSLGKFGGRPLVNRFFSHEKVEYVENQYRKYGILAVGIAGFTPIPYKVFTITSGLFNMNLLKFAVVSFFSRGARFFSVACFMYFWGEALSGVIIKYLNVFGLLFIVLLVGGFFVLNKIVKKDGKQNA